MMRQYIEISLLQLIPAFFQEVFPDGQSESDHAGESR